MTNQSTNITPDGGANNQPTVNERPDERLDDLTSFMESIGWEFDENGYTFDDNYINFRTADMLRQAFTSLTKELVAEAKPEDLDPFYGKPTADEYEQNILKALEQL